MSELVETLKSVASPSVLTISDISLGADIPDKAAAELIENLIEGQQYTYGQIYDILQSATFIMNFLIRIEMANDLAGDLIGEPGNESS